MIHRGTVAKSLKTSALEPSVYAEVPVVKHVRNLPLIILIFIISQSTKLQLNKRTHIFEKSSFKKMKIFMSHEHSQIYFRILRMIL